MSDAKTGTDAGAPAAPTPGANGGSAAAAPGPPAGAAPGAAAGVRRVSDLTAGPGGVMTDEVGVITGELTLASEMDASLAVTLRVQYKEAAEWYVVTGGRCQLRDAADLDPLHAVVVALLNRPEG